MYTQRSGQQGNPRFDAIQAHHAELRRERDQIRLAHAAGKARQQSSSPIRRLLLGLFRAGLRPGASSAAGVLPNVAIAREC